MGFFSTMFSGMMDEMRSHPYTTLSSVIAFSMAMYLFFYPTQAEELSSVKNQVAAVTQTVVDIRASQIEDKIISARIRFCDASSEDQKNYFRILTNEYAESYRKLTDRNYPLPRCDEI